MADHRPYWQMDACPPWCAGGHGDHDHEDDRVHRSRGVAVPVIFRTPVLEGDRVTYRVEEDDFEIGLSRADGGSTTWLYIGAGPGRSIEVTLDSARRLLRDALDHMRSVKGA